VSTELAEYGTVLVAKTEGARNSPSRFPAVPRLDISSDGPFFILSYLRTKSKVSIHLPSSWHNDYRMGRTLQEFGSASGNLWII